MTEPQPIDERAIRTWFMNAPLTEALTTHAIVEGILAMRQQDHHYKPRKKRKGADRPRKKLGQCDTGTGKLEGM